MSYSHHFGLPPRVTQASSCPGIVHHPSRPPPPARSLYIYIYIGTICMCCTLYIYWSPCASGFVTLRLAGETDSLARHLNGAYDLPFLSPPSYILLYIIYIGTFSVGRDRKLSCIWYIYDI